MGKVYHNHQQIYKVKFSKLHIVYKGKLYVISEDIC